MSARYIHMSSYLNCRNRLLTSCQLPTILAKSWICFWRKNQGKNNSSWVFSSTRFVLLTHRSHSGLSPHSLWVWTKGTSILGEVRNVKIPGPTQQLLCSKYHSCQISKIRWCGKIGIIVDTQQRYLWVSTDNAITYKHIKIVLGWQQQLCFGTVYD